MNRFYKEVVKYRQWILIVFLILAVICTQLLRAWIRNNFEESPEEISRIIYTLLNHEPLKS